MRKVQKEEIQRVIVKREARSYKGDFGRLLLIGGTYPYDGSPIRIGSSNQEEPILMGEPSLWQRSLRFIVERVW